MARKLVAALIAGAVLTSSLAVTAPAEAQWWRRGGYGSGWGHYHGWGWRGPGPFIGGAVVGLGVGAALAAPYYARPPVVYAPPPAYYPPPYPYSYYPPY